MFERPTEFKARSRSGLGDTVHNQLSTDAPPSSVSQLAPSYLKHRNGMPQTMIFPNVAHCETNVKAAGNLQRGQAAAEGEEMAAQRKMATVQLICL